MTSNTVCVTGEIDNVDFTREDGTSVTMLIPPDTQDALADHGEEL